ncbi:hypothetical protein ACKKBG_A36605 [Auxenochlorella protothecoides x Auxenochlorella symbiontica]
MACVAHASLVAPGPCGLRLGRCLRSAPARPQLRPRVQTPASSSSLPSSAPGLTPGTSGNGITSGGAPPPEPTPVRITHDVNVSAVLSPQAVYHKCADLGAYKAALPWWKIVLAGAMAGMYVSLGGMLLLTVGPNCVAMAGDNPGLARYITGAIGFPYALLTILTCGAELFTGNTAVVTAAVYEGKADLRSLAKSWICSYAGNILGAAAGVGLAVASGLLPQLTRGATALAIYKTGAPVGVTLARAIGANWLVCIAVWQCTAAQTYGGKFIACLGPISAFVTIGLEHCIANMFFVPLGILAGADVNMRDFVLRNLIPVTLGNIFAGVVCVATLYSLLYGALGDRIMGKKPATA